ncbi:arrestin domain-containing protein 17-like [Babylonia areolata]|uniref:arrestin domain-containing protein 17-like n=1 Tax=Babylonia areolata TaxID=304850 RepID=UPI003FCFAE71
MGKLTTFEILVDNRDAVVKAGDTVRGQVLVELSNDMDVSEIRIIFTGRSHVQWAGSPVQNAYPMAEVQPAAESEQANEVYFNRVVTLFPPPPPDGAPRKPGSRVRLERGSHLYDFEFLVPPTCPSSFSGVHGFVRYLLKAVVERAWKVDFNMRTITVESELDLNTLPEARDPVELSGDLQVYHLLFHSGDCHATLRLPRKGVIPGEILSTEFSVQNGSHQELHKVSLHLKMEVLYRAQGQKCTMEVNLCKVSLGKVPAGKTLEGRDRGLRVPPTCPPSGLPGCSLIAISYKVELKIKPARLSLKRLKLTSDIIVGTISLNVGPYHDSPPDYWSCCPPTYEDVMASSPRVLHTDTGGASSAHTSSTLVSDSDAAPVQRATRRHTLPPRYNDEPRVTVLRQASSPLSVESPGIGTQQLQPAHPLMRPRANTGPSARRPRALGR